MPGRQRLLATSFVAGTMMLIAGAAVAQTPIQTPAQTPTPSPGIGAIPERQATSPATGGAGSTPGFVRQSGPSHYLASRLDGADVYTVGSEEKIADIADLIISDRGEFIGIILSYGGLVGIAQSYVAVEPGVLRMRRVSATETRVETTLTAEQLRNAPKFDYAARPR